MLKKLRRVAGLVLNIQQRLQPRMGTLLQIGESGVLVLVQPVCRNARLGHMVHFSGTNLELNRRAIGANQRRM